MKYLLPCSCGQSMAIEVSQAGQSVQCTCGKTLDVPTMRLIRQLPPADEVPEKTRVRDRHWSLRQRLFFSCGLALLMGGLLSAAFFQMGRAGLETEERPWDNLERAYQDIDTMDIEQTWELWTNVRNESIGPYNPPPFIRHRLWSARWYRSITISLIVSAIGLVLTLSSFLARPQSPARRPAQPARRPQK
ncbi:MAG: hypothetical protein GXY58_08860 [Planctomycetaceae bacterium]|nr:hypothetical protein [Planctomycetaceae bacterium]